MGYIILFFFGVLTLLFYIINTIAPTIRIYTLMHCTQMYVLLGFCPRLVAIIGCTPTSAWSLHNTCNMKDTKVLTLGTVGVYTLVFSRFHGP